MSKRFDREQNEIDRLNKENRELKSLNRQLHKKLKQLNKGYYKYLLNEDDDREKAIEEVKTVAEKICFDCSIGEYKLMTIANRRWRLCSYCGKKGKVTIIT